MEYEAITHEIIGCAFEVFNELGFGFLEAVYERSLAIGLAEKCLDVRAQALVPVYFKLHLVGEYRADLIVNDLVIVELKSVEHLNKIHEVQLVNYLTATRKPIGLLLNFGPKGVEQRRRTPKQVLSSS